MGRAIHAGTEPSDTRRRRLAPSELLDVLRRAFEAQNLVRQGVCLLNGGEYKRAEAAFRGAMALGFRAESLPAYLAAALMAQRRPEEAAAELASEEFAAESQAVNTIRQTLALRAAGRGEEAASTLRNALRNDPECAGLHFQLGVLLASAGRYDEAELRFTQAINIDRGHAEALVQLALCAGVRRAPAEAFAHLQKAYEQRPHDARIGLLLAQAARAVQQQGFAVRARALMPPNSRIDDDAGIRELSRVIAAEPDFVDAFLSLPTGEVDEGVFAMLLRTLEVALEREPEQAELHYHCGRVLARLGRHEDAIAATERAVEIDPKFVRALIELGELYRQTDRNADAATRLEQAIVAGADYADVYYLLGNLHRDQGEIPRAREAYRHALELNSRYHDALQALEALPA